MEDSGTETDRSTTATGGDLSVSSGDTIPQSADKKFGSYSRDFEYDDAEYLSHADGLATDINGDNAKITVSAWIKIEYDWAGPFYAIAGKYATSTNQRQYYILWNSSTKKINAYISVDGTNAVFAVGATSLSTGVWYHVALVSNDTDMRIYIDGSLDSNGSNNPLTYSSGIFNGSAEFRIGNRVSTATPFDGLIDDVAVFSRDLSSTEVADIYNNGLSPTSIASLPSVLSDSVWADTVFKDAI